MRKGAWSCIFFMAWVWRRKGNHELWLKKRKEDVMALTMRKRRVVGSGRGGVARVCVLFLLFVTAPGLCFAAGAPVGWVQEAKGEALVLSSGGASRKAAVEMGVESSETLKTGAGGRLQVMFKDKTTLALDENSEIQVKDVYLDAAQPDKQRFWVKLVKGTVGFLTGALIRQKPERFKVEAPLGYLGVRGTEFAIAADTGKDTFGLYEGGPVVVTASAGGDAAKLQEICKQLDIAVEEYMAASDSWDKIKESFQSEAMMKSAQEARNLKRKYKCK
jgi:hypothetical protein